MRSDQVASIASAFPPVAWKKLLAAFGELICHTDRMVCRMSDEELLKISDALKKSAANQRRIWRTSGRAVPVFSALIEAELLNRQQIRSIAAPKRISGCAE